MSIKRFLVLGVVLLLAACNGATDETPVEPTVGLPNPASVNCAEQGGTLQIESRPDGGQFGVCFLKITGNVRSGLCCGAIVR